MQLTATAVPLTPPPPAQLAPLAAPGLSRSPTSRAATTYIGLSRVPLRGACCATATLRVETYQLPIMVLALSEQPSRTPTTRLAVLSSQLCSSATERAPVPRAAPAALAGAVSGAVGVQLSAAPAVIYKQRQLDELDREQFLRDGFLCLPGIMTPECRKLWSASLRKCQAIQDHMIFNTVCATPSCHVAFRPSPA
jgi:hypothetical protein